MDRRREKQMKEDERVSVRDGWRKEKGGGKEERNEERVAVDSKGEEGMK